MNSFTSHQVQGHGRGKRLGFPTVNLIIPEKFALKEGVYAVWVEIAKKKFRGAMHYGPVPVFNQSKPTLEVFLLDTTPDKLPQRLDEVDITVIPVQWLRAVQAFSSTEALVAQIEKDVEQTRKILAGA